MFGVSAQAHLKDPQPLNPAEAVRTIHNPSAPHKPLRTLLAAQLPPSFPRHGQEPVSMHTATVAVRLSGATVLQLHSRPT